MFTANKEFILRDEELVLEDNNGTSVENVYGGSGKGTQVSSGGCSSVASQNVSEVKVNYCNDFGDVIKTNWELRECDEAGYSKILRRGKERKSQEELGGREIYGERDSLFFFFVWEVDQEDDLLGSGEVSLLSFGGLEDLFFFILRSLRCIG